MTNILHKDNEQNQQVVQLGITHNCYTDYVIALAGLSRAGARITVFSSDDDEKKEMAFLPTASMDALCAAWTDYRAELAAKEVACEECGEKFIPYSEDYTYCDNCSE